MLYLRTSKKILSFRKYWRDVAGRDLARNAALKKKSSTEGRLGILDIAEYIFHTFV